MQGHADRERHVDQPIAVGNRRRGGLLQLLSHHHRLPKAGEVIEEHQEFVAPQPPGTIVLTNGRPDAIGRGGEHQITGSVSVGVVDALEVVEIAEQQGQLLGVLGPLPGQASLQPVEDGRPTRQAGERIGGGLPQEPLLLQHLAIHRVEGDHEAVLQVDGLGSITTAQGPLKTAPAHALQAPHAQFDPAPAPLGLEQLQASLPDRSEPRHPLAQIHRGGGSRVALLETGEQLGEGAAIPLQRRPAGHLLQGGRHPADDLVAIEQHHHLDDVLGEQTVKSGRISEIARTLRTPGDIAPTEHQTILNR